MSTSTSESRIDRPTFLVGMGRSGSTLIFESFARNRELGWFSYHLDRLPGFTPLAALARLCDVSPVFRKEIARSGEARRRFESLRDGPSEGWNVWRRLFGDAFLYDYLLERRASEAEATRARRQVAQVLRLQGKTRFAAKLTGPARIGFLMSVFPDARFVHIVRDGRDVVRSLLAVDFWRDSFRMREPAWRGGLTEEDLAAWEEADRDPAVLAAVQWRRVVLSTWAERDRHQPEAFHEIRYEDFLARPVEQMQALFAASELPPSPEAQRWLEEHARGARPEPQERGSHPGVDAILADVLERLGYKPA